MTEGFQGPFKMLLAQMEDNLMSTNTSNEKGTPQSRTYTVNDIAAILGIGRATAYKLANSGLFKTIRIGNMIRMVPSRVMRKFVCRFWLNEVSQQ